MNDVLQSIGDIIQKHANNTYQDAAVIALLDRILMSRSSELIMESVILSNNAFTVKHNDQLGPIVNTGVATAPLYALLTKAGNVSRFLSTASKYIESSMMYPNISGVPISVVSYNESREVEVSESMVIVQSQGTKKYWTDNAVPRLKEWNIEGYLTSNSDLDIGFRIKPTLTWQAYFLDTCAKSRRPVMFKTSRGSFVKVQITNLSLVEDPTYNNAIKITVSLKEYNPYTIDDVQGNMLVATPQEA